MQGNLEGKRREEDQHNKVDGFSCTGYRVGRHERPDYGQLFMERIYPCIFKSQLQLDDIQYNQSITIYLVELV